MWQLSDHFAIVTFPALIASGSLAELLGPILAAPVVFVFGELLPSIYFFMLRTDFYVRLDYFSWDLQFSSLLSPCYWSVGSATA